MADLRDDVVLPSFVIALRQCGRRGLLRIGDRGDQRDQLSRPAALAIGDLVLDHPHIAGLVLVQVLAAAGRSSSPCRALPLTLGLTSTDQ
jgi:hypothetical protein